MGQYTNNWFFDPNTKTKMYFPKRYGKKIIFPNIISVSATQYFIGPRSDLKCVYGLLGDNGFIGLYGLLQHDSLWK